MTSALAPSMLAGAAVVAAVLLALVARPVVPVVRVASLGGAARAGRTRPGGSFDRRRDDLIEFLDDIARQLRSGAALPSAVAHASRSHPSCLAPVPRLLGSGSTLGEALTIAGALGTTARVPSRRSGSHPDDSFVVQTLVATLRSGGRQAAPVERAAAVLRERRTWQHERRVQSAQARLSATVMTMLPVGFAAWSVLANARVRAAYVTSPVAIVCTLIGLAVNALGWWWMRHLVGGRSP